MALGGLWHGAAMTFVAWGLLQGVGLAGERFLSNLRGEQDTPIERRDVRLTEIAELNLGTKIQPWREDPTSPTPFAPLQVRNLAVGRLITFHFVCLSWILFRSDSFSTAGEILRGLASVPDSVSALSPTLLLVIAASLAAQFFPVELTKPFRAGFSQIHPAVHGAFLGAWIALVISPWPRRRGPVHLLPVLTCDTPNPLKRATTRRGDVSAETWADEDFASKRDEDLEDQSTSAKRAVGGRRSVHDRHQPVVVASTGRDG